MEDRVVPEADLQEQSQLVEEDQFIDRPPRRDESAESVSEADWLEQSMGVAAEDDDDRR